MCAYSGANGFGQGGVTLVYRLDGKPVNPFVADEMLAKHLSAAAAPGKKRRAAKPLPDAFEQLVGYSDMARLDTLNHPYTRALRDAGTGPSRLLDLLRSAVDFAAAPAPADSFIDEHPDGAISVSGIDTAGPFSIRGRYSAGSKTVQITGSKHRIADGTLRSQPYDETMDRDAFVGTVEAVQDLYGNGYAALEVPVRRSVIRELDPV